MDLSPVKQPRVEACHLAGACLLSLSSGAEAAESIRVLLSADVTARYPCRRSVVVTDAKAWSGCALRSRSQPLDGVCEWRPHADGATDAGWRKQGLTLTFPRSARSPTGRRCHQATRHGDLGERPCPSRAKRQGFWSLIGGS
jgi:hypothetical protein